MPTNRELIATRLAHQFMPELWAFAFPLRGRRFRLVRFLAFRLWVFLFRQHLRAEGVI
jgi:hypothetical protein